MLKGKKLFSLLLVLALMVSLFVLVPLSADAVSAPGKVMMMGGGMTDDNAEVYNALKAAAGGGTPKIAVICSASPDYQSAYESWNDDIPGYLSYQHLFQSYGFDPVFIPVALDNYTTEAYSQANVNLINTCQAVFFNGGDQSRHSRCMFTDTGADTPVMAAVRAVYNNGGVISGTSAGGVVMGDPTYGAGYSYGYLEANDMVEKQISDVSLVDPNDSNNGGYVQGFGFTSPYDAIVESHCEARGRLGRIIVALRELQRSIGIAVDENTAVLLNNDTATVYGVNGASIVDSSEATFPSDTYFRVNNLTISYLTSGDTYTFSTKAVTSTKPAVNSYVSSYNSSKIFNAYEASKVMITLVRSIATSATGMTKERNPRFTLTFSETLDTKGYYDPITGKATVDKLNLSISYQ